MNFEVKPIGVQAEDHVFDAATMLEYISDGRYRGATSQHYWNLVGPWGGITAAVMLRPIIDSPVRLGDPLSLTVNFCAAISEGEFEVRVREIRRGRTTQHWYIEIHQSKIVATATVVTGVRRAVWSYRHAVRPSILPVEKLAVLPVINRSAWLSNFELRFESGYYHPDDEPRSYLKSPRSNLWLRDAKQRPLDFLSLAAFSDIFFLRILLVRGRLVPAGTITLTTFFHADSSTVQEVGEGYLQGVADANVFDSGFSDQEAALWSPRGELLATSYQLVFYPE